MVSWKNESVNVSKSERRKKEERMNLDFPPINYKVWCLLYVSHVNLGMVSEFLYNGV